MAWRRTAIEFFKSVFDSESDVTEFIGVFDKTEAWISRIAAMIACRKVDDVVAAAPVIREKHGLAEDTRLSIGCIYSGQVPPIEEVLRNYPDLSVKIKETHAERVEFVGHVDLVCSREVESFKNRNIIGLVLSNLGEEPYNNAYQALVPETTMFDEDRLCVTLGTPRPALGRRVKEEGLGFYVISNC